jgi:hypothetical protein
VSAQTFTGSIAGHVLDPAGLEWLKLQFCGEFFNAWNHPQFNNPNGSVTSSSFGAIGSSQAGRVTEVALRLMF